MKQLKSQVLKKSLALLATVSSVAMAQSSAPTTTSTTTAPTTATAAANKFGLSLINETTNDLDTAATKGGAATVNALFLTYKPNDDLKLGVTFTSEYSLAGRGEKQADQKANYRDVSLSANVTHGSFLGTASTPVKYKFNLPTSEKSKNEKQAFSVAAEVTLGYELTNKLAANVILIPGWHLKNGTSDEIKNQTNAELRFAHTNKLSTYGFLDHKIRTFTDANLSKNLEVAAVGAGISYSPNKVIDLDLNIARERHLFASAAKNKNLQFTFADPKEISYTAGAVLKF